jgi:hypothetical protein
VAGESQLQLHVIRPARNLKPFRLVLPCLLVLCGCRSLFSTAHPAGGGYEARVTRYLSWEPPGITVDLCYRKPHGWPGVVRYNCGGPVVATNGMVVFLAEWKRSSRDYGQGIFAVRDAGPIVEIGDTVLMHKAKNDGTDGSAFIANNYPYSVAKWPDGVEFIYLPQYGIGQPRLSIRLTWNEVGAIMDKVQAEGDLHHDTWGRRDYRQIEYGVKQLRETRKP